MTKPPAMPELNPADIVVEIVRKPMGGFAYVNTSGVTVTHKPSGIGVTVDSARSQHINRQSALDKLRSTLAALQSAQPAEVSDDGLISKDRFYGDDHVQDIAHALAQECEQAELDPNDFVTVNREKLVAIAARVLGKARAILALRPAQQPESEPFGYFRALPFGWEQCSETDEGAVALYERPQSAQQAVPMTDEQIEAIPVWARFVGLWPETRKDIVRAIEAHHGITQRADGGEVA